MKVEWVKVGKLLELQRRSIVPQPDQSYREIGVRSFGKGLFVKESVTAQELGNKRVFEVREGDFVVSNVFGWEGAVGLAGAEHNGLIGSHRFMTWTCKEDVTTTRFVLDYFRSTPGVAALAAASPGSAGRNRTLSIKNFEMLEIPVPSREDQSRIAVHLDEVDQTVTKAAEAARLGGDATRRLRDAWFAELEQRVMMPLGSILSPVDQLEAVEVGRKYRTLGMRAWGRGAFASGTTTSEETSYKRLRRFRTGQVCYPKLTAWQGAFAVIPDELDGVYASPEFVGFEVDEKKASIRYVDHLLRSSKFARQAASGASGTNANRRRLQPRDFLALSVPLPSLTSQAEIAGRLDIAVKAQRVAERRAALAEALLPAVRNQIFTELVSYARPVTR